MPRYIKVPKILSTISKLEKSGAKMDEYVLIINPSSPALFYVMREADYIANEGA